jgi:hypothetical protein
MRHTLYPVISLPEVLPSCVKPSDYYPLEESRLSLPVAQGLCALYVYEGNFGKLSKLFDYQKRKYKMYESFELDKWTWSVGVPMDHSQAQKVEQGLSFIQWRFYVYES